MDEYLNILFNPEVWRKAPQLRSIPIVESIDYPNEVLAYEQAREIVRKQEKIILADCICRKERHLVGQGCDKPLETCLIFGGGAYYYERYGMGRQISLDEALAVLDTADQAGLVASANQCPGCFGDLLLLRGLLWSAAHGQPIPTPSRSGLVSLFCPGRGGAMCGLRCVRDPLPDGSDRAG